MNKASAQNERIRKMIFASVYPLYLTKVEKKGRTKEELDQVITWLTGFDNKRLKEMIDKKLNFETFFEQATINDPSLFPFLRIHFRCATNYVWE